VNRFSETCLPYTHVYAVEREGRTVGLFVDKELAKTAALWWYGEVRQVSLMKDLPPYMLRSSRSQP